MKPDLLNRVLAGLQVILVEPERAREIAGDLHDDVAEATVSSPLVASGGDWTAKDGTSNTSTRFLDLVDAVAHLIRDSAFTLISGDTRGVARLIMAQLAHVHGLMPATAIPAEVADLQRLRDEQAAEIERLRAIEAAAKKLVLLVSMLPQEGE